MPSVVYARVQCLCVSLRTCPSSRQRRFAVAYLSVIVLRVIYVAVIIQQAAAIAKQRLLIAQ